MKKLEETIEQIEQLLSKLFSYRLFWILSIIVAIIILVLAYLYWVSAPEFLDYDYAEQESHELHSSVIRNRGWFLWMILSFMGLLTGLYLTYWGRQIQEKQWDIQRQQWKTQEQQWKTQEKQSEIQHKTHLHERLEKVTTMLENQTMSTRITACRLLVNLAIDEKSMKTLCLNLLFSFINNPYLKPNEQDKDLNHLFPENVPLRSDIQSAIKSFSAIYDYYEDKGIEDDSPVDLPIYFWKNKNKGRVSLVKANLIGANLEKATLLLANLQGVNLTDADLQGVNLRWANLQGANLEYADLQEAILGSAKLQKACLSCVILRGADLRGANLHGADLNGSELQGAKFIRANLQEANLEKAILIEANLQDAILRGAKLENANLKGANLSGADLTGAEMSDVKNLTKKQILSAKCGFMEEGQKGGGWCSSILPEEFYNDPEVQAWNEKDHFNNEKKSS